MKKIIEIAINKRKITIFFVIILAIYGIYNYIMLPKQEAPDISPPYATITTIYPGASQENVEKLVTRIIEEELSQIGGFDYSKSYSSNNMSNILLALKFGTDTDKSWSELEKKLNNIQSELPEECYDIEINTDLTKTAGIIISLTGKNYTYDELAAYAKDIKLEISKIDGISKFDIDGDLSKQITVEIDYKKLNYYELSYSDIVSLLNSQNIKIPSGSLSNGNSKIIIDTSGSLENIEDIRNIIIGISEKNSSVIKLGDIAEIYTELEDSNYKIKDNGKNAVLLTGYFNQNENIITIGKKVEKKISELEQKLPNDITFNQVLFQPDEVSRSVNIFLRNLIAGIVLVILVVFLGMGFKNAIIVSTVIPLSILMTFNIMPIFGVKVHSISVASLIVALGMLVDNAIVVSDSIQAKIDYGDEKKEACIQGTREVAIPILTSTLTTIAAFSPLLMLNSIVGDYIKSLPQIVIISLSSSYLIALLVTPTMAYIFFEKNKRKKKQFRIKNVFSILLKKGMKRKKETIIVSLLIICTATFILQQLNIIFFPSADKDIMYINLKADKNIDIQYTETFADQVCGILEDQVEITNYTVAIGSDMPKFYDTMGVMLTMVDNAQIMIVVDLQKGHKFKTNEDFAYFLQNKINCNVVGGKAKVKLLEYAYPIEAPIAVRFAGNDFSHIVNINEEAVNILNNIEGTDNVRSDYRDKIYEYKIIPDDNRLSIMGLTKYDIQNEISIAVRGRKATTLRNEGEELGVIVKSNISKIEELENLKIKSSITNNKILLKEVADIQLEANTPTIIRKNGQYSIIVYSDVKKGYNRQVILSEFNKQISNLDNSNIDIIYEGENEVISENFESVGNAAIIAIIAVFFILLIQFNSILQPFIIFLTVPLSSVGALLGLYITRQPLSFTALLGIVSLMGIVVNNAIVLIDYINGERKKGKNVDEACREAAEKRFRPIILSAITTIIGLIPLAISSSEIFKPMSIALMFGLLVSTILTLVAIPVVYSIVINKMRI